jgi:surfeit locus 1 family protein
VSRRARLAPAIAAVVAVAILLALGVWQVERRAWKLALIARVERQLAALPIAAPGPASWPSLGTDDAYRRVSVVGRYRARADSFVQAVTDYGGGYWVLTPLDTGRFTVLVNRGFLPADWRGRVAPPEGVVSVTGLLRLSEPGGGFLRRNDPAADRWYSRDVAAIARAKALGRVAPYFIDADRGGPGWPRGGLTVIRFANNHLIYALTWFGLAALIAAMAWRQRARAR